MEITLSIIGTAGRDKNKELTLSHFNAMYAISESILKQLKESGYEITTAVSGGAAWADHCAVKLFLNNKVKKLRLFLPCEWDNGSFHIIKTSDIIKTLDNNNDWKTNPGKTANYFHKLFQTKTNINGLSDIQTAKYMGAELINGKSFHGRNSLVAKSDFLLAMTFGNKNEVADGGTADTCEKYLNRVKKEGFFDKSFHYNLNDGILYHGIKLPLKEKKESMSGITKRFGTPFFIMKSHGNP